MKNINYSKKHSKKPFIILAIIIVLLVLGAFARLYWPKPQQHTASGTSYNKPTPAQQDQGNKTKAQVAKPNATSGSDQPPAPTPISGSTQQNIGLTITAANQNGSTFQVRTVIDTVTNSGTCTLTMSQAGSTTVTRSANVQPLATTSTCQGFDIPVSSLASGDWNLTVSFSNDSLVGSASKKVTIQ